MVGPGELPPTHLSWINGETSQQGPLVYPGYITGCGVELQGYAY